MPLNNTYSILETLASSAADISVSNHMLSITGCPSMDFRSLTSTAWTAPVAETLQITTVTPTVANSTYYELTITQFVNGQYNVQKVFHTTPSSGATATTICDALRAQLATYSNIKITGSGTTTFIMTAQAGYPIFTAVSTGAGTLGVVTGTPGVHSVGTYADLVAAGVTTAVSGHTYYQVAFTYVKQHEGLLNGNLSTDTNVHTLYVYASASNFSAFNTRMGEVLNAYPSGGSTYPDHEILALA